MDKNNKNKKNERGIKMNITVKRPCTPLESLEQSIKEMKQMRNGELPKKSWRNMFAEIKKQEKE